MPSVLAFVLAAASLQASDCRALREFDAITELVTQKFYDRTFRGLDWPSRIAGYRKQLSCDAGPRAVARTANRLLSELHASHTGVYTRSDFEYWALESIFAKSMDDFKLGLSGIWAERADGTWYARYVLPGSPADVAGVRPGAELLRLDGRAFDPLGFAADRRSTLYISLSGHGRQQISLVAGNESVQRSLLDATERSAQVIDVGPRRVGYFHLWSGTRPEFLTAMKSALSRLEAERVDAIILDLRGGYGGANLDYVAPLRSTRYLTETPKYVLIDDGVRSGKEWVAAVIKNERLATLVGSKTAGAFLGGLANHLFDDRYFVYVAGREFIPPDVGRIEGVGVEPDIAVNACHRLCDGKDPQLEGVFDLIRDLPVSRAHG